MRELKFRAWNKLEKEFVNNVNCLSDMSVPEMVFVLDNEREDLIIEQYTGLKDKNGKEVFDGDIVRICRSYGYGFLPKGAVAVVSYDENECCYKLKKQGEFRLTNKKMIEVIGNIHENKELLEEEE